MGFFRTTHKKGFTLVEILVALSILALLAAIVMMNMSEAKKKARDTQRISDLQQLAVAFRMHRDFNSVNPTYTNGIVLGEGGALDAVLLPYLSKMVMDPRGSGSESTYEYKYDSDYVCNGVSRAVLYVKTMERTNAGNWASVCGTTYSDGTGVNTYGMILQ
jgi:prepilin-type N-terminal cleavage/methylation domain-containing protein